MSSNNIEGIFFANRSFKKMNDFYTHVSKYAALKGLNMPMEVSDTFERLHSIIKVEGSYTKGFRMKAEQERAIIKVLAQLPHCEADLVDVKALTSEVFDAALFDGQAEPAAKKPRKKQKQQQATPQSDPPSVLLEEGTEYEKFVPSFRAVKQQVEVLMRENSELNQQLAQQQEPSAGQQALAELQQAHAALQQQQPAAQLQQVQQQLAALQQTNAALQQQLAQQQPAAEQQQEITDLRATLTDLRDTLRVVRQAYTDLRQTNTDLLQTNTDLLQKNAELQAAL